MFVNLQTLACYVSCRGLSPQAVDRVFGCFSTCEFAHTELLILTGEQAEVLIQYPGLRISQLLIKGDLPPTTSLRVLTMLRNNKYLRRLHWVDIKGMTADVAARDDEPWQYLVWLHLEGSMLLRDNNNIIISWLASVFANCPKVRYLRAVTNRLQPEPVPTWMVARVRMPLLEHVQTSFVTMFPCFALPISIHSVSLEGLNSLDLIQRPILPVNESDHFAVALPASVKICELSWMDKAKASTLTTFLTTNSHVDIVILYGDMSSRKVRRDWVTAGPALFCGTAFCDSVDEQSLLDLALAFPKKIFTRTWYFAPWFTLDGRKRPSAQQQSIFQRRFDATKFDAVYNKHIIF
jgi:hypothetical protein